jgi:uncharacterized protein YcnI
MPLARLRAAAVFALAFAAAAPPASAHVSLEVQQAQAGVSYKGVFRVPHGCDGRAMIAMEVRLPEGVTEAKPMPKPGWTLRTERRPLREPVPDGHGGTVTETVALVRWEGGPLPDEHYDEFVLRFRTPPTPGETLWIPVVQHCEGGATAAWTEIPEPGRRITDYRHPAPSLRLTGRN